MGERWKRGRMAEEVASVYLAQQGFTIRHTHWQCGHKELDIIAERGQMLHVVEVRSRTAPCLVAPPQTVLFQKQKNVMAAAREYIFKYRITKEVQFDIVSVVYDLQDIKIEYIPNAFYPLLR